MSLAEARQGLGVWIGHYGCGRLVKVFSRTAGERSKQGWMKPKLVHRIECPACGYEHKIRVMWRRPVRDDEHEAAEVEL